MLLNSLDFLVFFPIVCLLYFAIPQKVKIPWLLLTSYYFYACWNPQTALLLAASTVTTYLAGRAVERLEGKGRRRAVLLLCLALNIGILIYFKYTNFMLRAMERGLGFLGVQFTAPELDIMLPVGISFYTFQVVGYLIDVYRGKLPAERDLCRYALFVSFFPHILSGPIDRSDGLLWQLQGRCVDQGLGTGRFSYERVRSGLLLFGWGCFQKMVLSDRLAILVGLVFDQPGEYSGYAVWLASLCYTLQIYADFTGYSNMALGAAEVLGFRLRENFRQPYFATSIADFWRCWHVSLSSWLRDYVYIPLGGSRCSKARKYMNVMVTFLVSGIWHGANWTYILWGLLHGFYQVVGGLTAGLRGRLIKALGINTACFSYTLFQRCVTFSLVSFAWIFFRASGIRAAWKLIRSMWPTGSLLTFLRGGLLELGLSGAELGLVAVSVVLLFSIDAMSARGSVREKLFAQNLVFRWALYLLLIFSILIFGVYGPGYDAAQFVYLQF